MIVTMVSGQLPEARNADIEAAFKQLISHGLPAGLVESFLLHGEANTWRIATVWASQEALDEMRRSTDVPGAIRVFRSVGVEPDVAFFETLQHVTDDGDQTRARSAG